MSKSITNTTIHLEFLKVEEGETTLVTIPSECDRDEFARILRHCLSDGRTVLTDCVMNEYDDPIDMLMNLTDPYEDWTVDDARNIMSEAEAQGWNLDPQLTPEDILAIYNDLNNEEEDD